MKKKIVSVMLMVFFLSPAAIAMADEQTGDQHHHHVALFVGYASETKPGHQDENGFALGLEWEYRFHEKWGAGVVVEGLGQDTIRNVIVVAPISFHPGGHWRLLAGPGIEFTDKKDKLALRLGAGYEIPIMEQWSLAPEIFVDLIDSGEITWSGGLALGYAF